MFVCLSLSHQTNGHWWLSNTLSTYTELHIYYTNGALSVVHIYENDIFTCQYTWGTFLHKFITCYNNLFTDFFVNPQFLPITEIDSNQISQIKPIFSSLKKKTFLRTISWQTLSHFNYLLCRCLTSLWRSLPLAVLKYADHLLELLQIYISWPCEGLMKDKCQACTTREEESFGVFRSNSQSPQRETTSSSTILFSQHQMKAVHQPELSTSCFLHSLVNKQTQG